MRQIDFIFLASCFMVRCLYIRGLVLLGGVMKKNKIVVIVLGFLFIGSHLYGRRQIDITIEILQQDADALKKYVIEGIAPNIPRAKQAGKRVVKLVAGISYYAFDSIPWSFFADEQGMRDAFERVCNEVCASYIQAGKEKYKTTVQRCRPRLSRSRLGEFLHRHMIDTCLLYTSPSPRDS